MAPWGDCGRFGFGRAQASRASDGDLLCERGYILARWREADRSALDIAYLLYGRAQQIEMGINLMMIFNARGFLKINGSTDRAYFRVLLLRN